MQIFKIDQSNPDPAVVAEIAELLKTGSVIAFPTDTFYGLGADIYNDNAVKRVFDLKGRMYNKPILILISDKKELPALISPESMSVFACQLIDKFWPGPLTIIFYSARVIPPILTGHTGKIGIRLPNHTFSRRLVEKLGGPLTATSANISGMPGLNNPSDVLSAIGDRIDALIDGGMAAGGDASTVVDVTGVVPVIIREGVIPPSDIRETLGLPAK